MTDSLFQSRKRQGPGSRQHPWRGGHTASQDGLSCERSMEAGGEAGAPASPSRLPVRQPRLDGHTSAEELLVSQNGQEIQGTVQLQNLLPISS